MKNIFPSFTVGITTCYGKRQIVKTVESLRKSVGVPYFDIIIVADRIPVDKSTKKELKRLQVRLIENLFPKSVGSKQKQILSLVKTDLIFFTQDDVIFEKDALQKVLAEFVKDPNVTLVGLKNTPLPAQNIFEAGVNIGTNLTNRIAKSWNCGNNYLALIGRLMAVKTKWLKNTLDFQINIVSDDAYLYLENERSGGKYKCVWDSTLYFRNPQNMKEHLKKSSRFQYSSFEMTSQKKFINLNKKYQIPFNLILTSASAEFIKHPLAFGVYIFIFAYTRVHKLAVGESLTANWDVDLSTKMLD